MVQLIRCIDYHGDDKSGMRFLSDTGSKIDAAVHYVTILQYRWPMMMLMLPCGSHLKQMEDEMLRSHSLKIPGGFKLQVQKAQHDAA